MPVASVGVGAGVEEVNGKDRVHFVGCDVERGALLSINVAGRFRVRDECGAHGEREPRRAPRGV